MEGEGCVVEWDKASWEVVNSGRWAAKEMAWV